MVTKEKDEELALFLELRRREKEKEKEKEKNNLFLLQNTDDLGVSSLAGTWFFIETFLFSVSVDFGVLGSGYWFDWFLYAIDCGVPSASGSYHNNNSSNIEPAACPASKMVSSVQPRRTAAENFLYSENEKSDYDW